MTTKKTNSTVRFTVDFFDGKIIATKTAFNRASKGIAPYYEELTTLMKTHSDYELIIKEPKKKTRKPKATYFGMDYDFMERYIAIQKNSDVLLSEFESVKAYAEAISSSPYPTMKRWFLREFNTDGEGFDMDKAWEEIRQAEMDGAILDAHDKSVEEEAKQTEMDNTVILPQTA